MNDQLSALLRDLLPSTKKTRLPYRNTASPDEVMRVVDLERQAAAHPWERHEYRVWVENHAPPPAASAAADTRRQTQRERNEARQRAKWQALRDAGNRSALARELSILRNRVRRRPADHMWADWQIRELGDILATMPPTPEEKPMAPTMRPLTSSPGRQARPIALQQVFFAVGAGA